MYYSEQIGLPRTDPKNWRLRTDPLGRETWHYEENKDHSKQVKPTKEPHPITSLDDPLALKTLQQSLFVQYHLQLDEFEPPTPEKITTPGQAAAKGAEFFELLQDKVSGTFPCQYKGPMFMTISYVAANYISGLEIPLPYRTEMIRYIVNTCHPVDGGWGLHSADKSTCFGTTMNYVCLRFLGLSADHPVCVKARKLLVTRLGGALGNPHWGKAWLSLLSLYEWEGVNPAPPEMWLLPESFPIHPGKWWVHTRAIYLPLGYVAANKVHCEVTPLIKEIRQEIYSKPYEEINFLLNRNNVCGIDLYYPHTKVLDLANWMMVKYEKYLRPSWLLQKANARVYELIQKECANTDYLCIAPINFAFNMIVTWCVEGSESDAFRRFQNRMNDVLFHGPQGMTVMGTNGVQVWDVAFMIQYLYMTGLELKHRDMIRRGYDFLVRSQFVDECAPGSFRDKRKGGWPFLTKSQGYTVSDCTAEALKAIIMVQNDPANSDDLAIKEAIAPEDLYEAVDVILNIQNKGSFEFGSFSSYEKIRTTPLLENLNPAEVFNKIMVEYPYVECTDSSVLGLTYFHKYYPNHRGEEISQAIRNAIQYITEAQSPRDGSWFGSWGVCYTYASMFALEAYNAVGETYATNESVRRGCEFLLLKQRDDGGWSESMKSCETETYVNSEQSLVVQTAWALIGLILAEYPEDEPISRGIKLLMERQLPTGEWKYEDIEGVFNHSCAIEYPSYKFLFPIKALGLYSKRLAKSS